MIQSVCRILTSMVVVLFILQFDSVQAQQSDRDELEIGLLIKDFGYQELSANNQILNKETGPIAGLGLIYYEQYGALVLQLDGAFYDGTIDYVGQTQSGNPITTRSDARIGELNIFLTHWLKQQTQLRFGIYTGLGLYYWERDIRSTTTAMGSPVAGLSEKYLIGYGSLGVKAKLLLSDQSSWSVDVRASKVLDANIDIDFQEFGGFDNTSLDIGKKYGYRIGFPWEKKLSLHSSLIINPYYEFWKFGVSNIKELTTNGIPSGTNILEPKSETSNYGLNFGFRQLF